MTDRLTPAMLRDLAAMIEKHDAQDWPVFFREEAARREAKQPCWTPGGCEVGGCLKPSLCQAAAVEDKPAPAADDLVRILREVTESDAYAQPWTFGEHCREAADRIEAQARHIDHWRGSFINEQKANEALKAENAQLRDALERISWLTPNAANARSAGELYHTVKAIADTALARGGDHG